MRDGFDPVQEEEEEEEGMTMVTTVLLNLPHAIAY